MPLLTEMSPVVLLSHVLRNDMDAWREAVRRLKRLEKLENLEEALRIAKGHVAARATETHALIDAALEE